MDPSSLQGNFSKTVFIVSVDFNIEYSIPLIKCITYVYSESDEVMSRM